jgi:SpoIVB peptidase S55
MPRLRSIVGPIGAAAAATSLAASAAGQVPPAPPLPECAEPVAPASLTPGQAATGYTVRRGELVEPFEVEILGVLENGIAPGRDLIVVDTAGPVIDEGGGGISAGMSGSPVLTDDGGLIGAVAYGFTTGPSSIGGVTPSPDMLDVLKGPAAATRTDSASDGVELTRGLRTQIASHAGVAVSGVPTEMSRLRVPLSVSGGLLAERRALLQRAVDRKRLPLIITGGASASAPAGVPTATVAPGDAFAAALSYGDVTSAAIGTATYVCDDQIAAFGHPFLFSGRTMLGASRASVLTVVDDPTFTPFKLAAVGDPLGIVDRDRLAAIRGVLGETAPLISVTQDTRALDTGQSRLDALTEIVRTSGAAAEMLPFTVATHAFANIDSTFDQIGAGTSRVSFTVEGIRARSGRPWSLVRSNRWASDSDISFGSIPELIGFTAAIQGQDLARVKFTSIDIEIAVERAVRAYEIGRVRWSLAGGPFRSVDRIRARPGQRITAAVPLRATDGHGRRAVKLRFEVPHRDRGGLITISGGGTGDAGLLCLLFGECAEDSARTFRGLLAKLEATPRNDELLGIARFGRSERRDSERLNKVVRGRDALQVIVDGDHGDGGRGDGPPGTVPAPPAPGG